MARTDLRTTLDSYVNAVLDCPEPLCVDPRDGGEVWFQLVVPLGAYSCGHTFTAPAPVRAFRAAFNAACGL